MALSEALKANLKANTEYYKANTNTLVHPEWGFPSTLDAIEIELKNPDISLEDKKILLDWMDAFQAIQIQGDTMAEERRAKIKIDIQKLRGTVGQVPPTVAASRVAPGQKSYTLTKETAALTLNGDQVAGGIVIPKDRVIIIPSPLIEQTIPDSKGIKVTMIEVTILPDNTKVWIQKSDLPSSPPESSPPSPQNLSEDLKKLQFGEISSSPESLRKEFEKVQSLPVPLQMVGWSVFFSKLQSEGYVVSFSHDPKRVSVRTTNNVQEDSVKAKKKTDIENQIRTLTETDTTTRKNILIWLLLQQGVFKDYIETNKKVDGTLKIDSISKSEFSKYLNSSGRAGTLAWLSLEAYDDTLLREAASSIPTQREVTDWVAAILAELQKSWAIDVNAPATAIPADLRDAFAGNLSLPSSPIILAGGGLLYGFMKKDWGFLQWLKYGLIGVLVAIFGGMGSDWLKKNLGYDLGFTLGEQKVGLMKLEKKVNDLRNASGLNSRLTDGEIALVKWLVWEFDSKWKATPSVSPVGPAVAGMMDGNFDIDKRLTDSPELNAYEAKINAYYLRAGGAIDSGGLAAKLKEIEAKLVQEKASSTSWAGTPAAGASAATWAASTANPAPVPAAASTIDTSKLTPSQKKAYDSFKDNTDIKKYIENISTSNPTENGDLSAYATFIFSDAFQNQKLENIIYTTDAERDIFHNDSKTLLIRKPANLNAIILKRILRCSLIGNQSLTTPAGWAKEGDKEKADFITKYPETTWKQRTLADITTEIHKQ